MERTQANMTARGCLPILIGITSTLWAQQYVISTYAGGAPPPTPIAGVSASIGIPTGVATDPAGNVYFSSLNCVLKLDPSGVLTRVAGTSRAGYSGDGGPATSAQLNTPEGIALDSAGNLYIADLLNGSVRKVSPAGIISTAYHGGTPFGIAVDGTGNLYVADPSSYQVLKVSSAGAVTTFAGNGQQGYSGDGGPAVSAEFIGPYGVAVDRAGNFYIADDDDVRMVSAEGVITTIAGGGTGGLGDGGPATSAQLRHSTGVVVDSRGNLFIADSGHFRIREVSPAGTITTIAGGGTGGLGDGGPATSAMLNNPSSVAVENSGNLYIADLANSRIRNVSRAGIITTSAGNGYSSYSGDGGPATSAQLSASAVAVDSAGNLYIADSDNYRIRKVSPDGVITTIAGTGTGGYSGDGGLAINAQINLPYAVAVDSAGNVYIADLSYVVRKVSPEGIITTVAGNGTKGYSGDGGPATNASLNVPTGIAVDNAGNLYIADFYNQRVRMVSPERTITTVAGGGTAALGAYGNGEGGPATNAEVDPLAVAVDAAGNLYIVGGSVEEVSPSGIITTIAGGGSQAYAYGGDGGPATSAQLNQPRGVTVDSAGNVYIADSSNDSIRLLQPAGPLSTTSASPLPQTAARGPAAR